jgi:hypothetical protein
MNYLRHNTRLQVLTIHLPSIRSNTILSFLLSGFVPSEAIPANDESALVGMVQSNPLGGKAMSRKDVFPLYIRFTPVRIAM